MKEIMREKIQTTTLICALMLSVVANVHGFTKYGRRCTDIGCKPNEQCVIKHDSCSYAQREGSDCGSYPACERTSNVQSSSGASLNPAPENTYFSRPSNPSPDTHPQANHPNPYNPNNVFGAPQVPNTFPNNWPIFRPNTPTSPPAVQQFPQPNHPRINQNYPQPLPYNPFNTGYIFGHQPPGLSNYPYVPPSTTREPLRNHQFSYNRQGRRRSSSSHLVPGLIVFIVSFIFHSLTYWT